MFVFSVRPLLRVAVNDEIVHFFREQLARHGNTDGCVDLVTSEHPNLSPEIATCLVQKKTHLLSHSESHLSQFSMNTHELYLTSFHHLGNCGSFRGTRIPACRSLGCSMSAIWDKTSIRNTWKHMKIQEVPGNTWKMPKIINTNTHLHITTHLTSSTRCSRCSRCSLRDAARWSLELRLAAYHRWLWLRVTSQAWRRCISDVVFITSSCFNVFHSMLSI